MNAETTLRVLGMLPGPLDIWSENTHSRPLRPARPNHPRPKRRRPSAMRTAWQCLDAHPDILQLIYMAEDEDACHEAMIWEAGRIHGPEGLDAADLVLELAAEAIEGGEPPTWWEDWTVDDIDTARAAIQRACHEAGADRKRFRDELRAIDAEPCADPAWRKYDEERTAYPARLDAYRQKVRQRAREVTGYESREEHCRALYGVNARGGA